MRQCAVAMHIFQMRKLSLRELVTDTVIQIQVTKWGLISLHFSIQPEVRIRNNKFHGRLKCGITSSVEEAALRGSWLPTAGVWSTTLDTTWEGGLGISGSASSSPVLSL